MNGTIDCPYGGGCLCGCADAANCYRRACDNLAERLLAASSEGATGREIDQTYIDGMRDLGAPDSEIATWIDYARR